MTSSAARGVTITDLEHSYTEEPILHGVSLDVAPGESIALLGPSGCGKTTLLRLVAGLEKPSSGSITIGGEPVAGDNWVPPDRRRVGMVFQDWALFPHLSVAKNVAYGITKSSTKDAEVAAALEMMDLAGLDDRREIRQDLQDLQFVTELIRLFVLDLEPLHQRLHHGVEISL